MACTGGVEWAKVVRRWEARVGLDRIERGFGEVEKGRECKVETVICLAVVLRAVEGQPEDWKSVGGREGANRRGERKMMVFGWTWVRISSPMRERVCPNGEWGTIPKSEEPVP